MATPSSALIASTLLLEVLITGCATTAQPQAEPGSLPAEPGSLQLASASLQSGAASRPSAAVVAPGPGDWMTWSRDQKFAYMKTTFMEAQRKLFASFLPVRFREIECKTCHGTIGVRNGSFLMPNPDLPTVAPGPDGFKELAEHEPEVLRFMQSRLVPETARLLGLPAFDFKTHQGFSCYQCHPRGQ